MKVLVCGSRGFTNGMWLYSLLDSLPVDHIISGGAKGADQMGSGYADLHGLDLTEITPDWDKYGKRAGYLRNIEMLDLKPDKVIAGWDGESKGTLHTISEAVKRGIPVEIVPNK